MSTKNIIISLIGVIIIVGAVYLAMSKKSTEMLPETQPISTTKSENVPGVTPEPTAAASNDQIIDYIVDGQAADITTAAEAELNVTVPTIDEPAISTNF